MHDAERQVSGRLLVEHPAGYEAERAYVYGVVLRDFLGLDCRLQEHAGSHVRLTVEGDPGGCELVLADGLFQTPAGGWLHPDSLPQQPLSWWKLPADLRHVAAEQAAIPILYRSPAPELLEQTTSGYALNLDLFGSIFFMLTRYEELVSTTRDGHDRFPASASLAAQAGFLERPLVNEYVELLWAFIARLWPSLRRRRRDYRLILSHDVDNPFSAPFRGNRRSFVRLGKTLASDLARRRDPLLAARRVRAAADAGRGCHDRDPWNTFDFIMDLSERHGIRSAFYFMTDGTSLQFDGNYEIDDPWVRALMRRISHRGHEIGLHTSYAAYRDPCRTRLEFERLLQLCDRLGIQQPCWGGRQHYLRWQNPTTWQSCADAGLAYDSTLGFADTVGFRSGTCCEYPAFNLRTRRPLALKERPLIVMDGTLFVHQRLRGEAVVQKILDLKALCRHYRGDFTLLWHNGNLNTSADKSLYTRVIQSIVM